MTIILLCLAIILLFMGHTVRVLRWRQFIKIYEEPNLKLLLRALSYGYLVNFILPFRLGEFIRAYCAGKKLENGVPFSLVTILLECCIDVWAVGLFFSIAIFIGNIDTVNKDTILFYIILTISMLISLILILKLHNQLKKLAKNISSMFNDNIKLRLLTILWTYISAFKDMFHRVNKMKLLFNTACMWVFYLMSYYVMSLTLTSINYPTSFLDFFTLLFDSKNLNLSIVIINQNFDLLPYILILTFIAVPLILLLLLSILPKQISYNLNKISSSHVGTQSIIYHLPQLNAKDKLTFLEKYFSSEEQEYIKIYIHLNHDVMILEDYSAGSSATTILCMDKQSTFFRKYVFGKDTRKLQDQINWLEEHENDIPVPKIIKKQIGQNYCCYDMPCYPMAMSMFQYLHSTDLEECWGLLKAALCHLHENIHQKNVRAAEPQLIEQYIEQKVLKNLIKIEQARELDELLHYNTLIINGKTYRGYNELKQWITKPYLLKIFSQDEYADIHGDLTIENIVCLKQKSETTYYFIDPNTNNLHDSPFLDYSKLLQSLHGGYEFLMRTNSININGNEINYLFTLSHNYSDIFKKYHQFLIDTFTYTQVRSIYFHEIVHWLRLMPYKIENDSKRAALFFSGMIIIFNDIVDWFGEINK
ncbi:MAG: flippase-like domain-containing protein [Desulfovibrionaceae bacterium]|nr:flippase-like domain-containing protein [Desulfovibrionaceae bacterium]